VAGLLWRTKLWVWRQIANRLVFQVGLRERLCRQEFFYNAFKALSFNGIEGDYAEFGCHQATTFALAHQEIRRHRHGARMFAFDSFQGLPAATERVDDHPAWVAGQMATSLGQFHAACAAAGIPRSRYEVVPGFYEDTLPGFPADRPPTEIALAYVDCDLYTSTRSVLRFLRPRLKNGMIIAFDDYYCWSKAGASGERTAMLECFADDPRWRLEPYMRFGWHGNSFVVEERA
jgi:hypothetical protein